MASDALLDHSGLSLEAALVQSCATTAVTPSRTAMASELAARVRSWARVAEIAKCHGVLPLVHRYLNLECQPAVPHAAIAMQRTRGQNGRL